MLVTTSSTVLKVLPAAVFVAALPHSVHTYILRPEKLNEINHHQNNPIRHQPGNLNGLVLNKGGDNGGARLPIKEIETEGTG